MRRRKVLWVAASLAAVTLLAFAVLGPRQSGLPEVRLNQLLPVKAGQPMLDSIYTPDLAGTATGPRETWMAEFLIKVPAGSRTGLTNGPVGVEILGAQGNWIRTKTRGHPPALKGPSPSRPRTICRTIWVALPPWVERCRFTVAFRRESFRDRTIREMEKWHLSWRFPALSVWIQNALPKTEKWLVCRREVAVSLKPSAPAGP